MNNKTLIKINILFAVVNILLFFTPEVYAAGMVLGTIGGVVGGMIGGPIGAQLGFALGSMAGNMLFRKTVKQEGPKLNDLRVQTNTYGISIPRCWGTVRTAGNIIYSSDIIQSEEKEEVDGKGQPAAELTTYSYSVNMAISICKGEISAVRKIWANEVLVYDISQSNTGAVGDIKYALSIYKGSQTQMPDPTIQLDKGVYTPAYRGLAYVMFTGLQLEKFGNQIPSFKFEIIKSESDVDSKLITDISYSYGTQNDNNLVIADIKVNPVNDLVYVLRCSSEIPSSTIYPLAIDIIDPISKTLIKTKLFKLTKSYTGTSTLKLNILNFSTNGDLVIFGVVYYDDVSGSVIYPSTNNRLFAVINKDTLTLKIQNTEDANTGNTFLDDSHLTTGGEIKINEITNIRTIAGQRNIPGDNNSFGVWRFVDAECTGYNLYTTTKYLDVKDSNYIAIDKKTDDIYFISYEDSTKKIAYLNKISFSILYEAVATIYTDASYEFGFTDIFFDTVTRKVFIANYKGGITSSNQMTVTKIDADDYTLSSFNWGGFTIGGNTGYVLPALNIDLKNRRFISDVNFLTGSDGYISYLYFDNFNVENLQYNKADIVNTSVGYPRCAYVSDIDADLWIGNPNTTTNTAYVIINYGYRALYSFYDLGNCVKEILIQTGLDDSYIDVTELNGTSIRGYVQTSTFTARGLIEPLAVAYNFDAIESDGKIKFKMRGRATTASITNNELSAKFYNNDNNFSNDLTSYRTQELELPKIANLIYLDFEKEYTQNTQEAKRYITTTENIVDLELPIVFTSSEAKQLIDRIMYAAWSSRDKYTFETNNDYIDVEPSDVVKITKDGNEHLIRITKKDESQGILKFEGMSEDLTVYTQNGVGVTGELGNQTIEVIASTNLTLLDIPIFDLSDNDYGMYAVVNKNYGSKWTGASIFSASDYSANFDNIDSINVEAKIGYCVNSLPDANNKNVFEIGYSLTVEMQNGDLISVSDDDIFNGKNLCSVNNEILQFKEATLVATNTYELTGFMRSRFGTEAESINHEIGEKFVLFNFTNGSIKRLERSNTNFNNLKYYKAVSFGKLLSDANVITFNNTAKGLKPYSVTDVKLSAVANTSLSMFWSYRVRGQGLLRNYVDVEADGDGEVFEIDVYSPGSLSISNEKKIKTYTVVDSKSFTYTNTQFQADLTSALLPTVTISSSNCRFEIFKVSSKVGRSDKFDTGYSALNN